MGYHGASDYILIDLTNFLARGQGEKCPTNYFTPMHQGGIPSKSEATIFADSFSQGKFSEDV